MFEFNDENKTINVLQRGLESFLASPRSFDEVKEYYISNNLGKYSGKEWQHHNKYQYVYIFRKKNINELYVGESKNIISRLGDYINMCNISQKIKKDLKIYEFEYFLKRVDDSELEEARYIQNYLSTGYCLYNIQRPTVLDIINRRKNSNTDKIKTQYKNLETDIKGFKDLWESF